MAYSKYLYIKVNVENLACIKINKLRLKKGNVIKNHLNTYKYIYFDRHMFHCSTIDVLKICVDINVFEKIENKNTEN